MAGRLLVFVFHCHPGRGAAREWCDASIVIPDASQHASGAMQSRDPAVEDCKLPKRDPRFRGDDAVQRASGANLHCHPVRGASPPPSSRTHRST